MSETKSANCFRFWGRLRISRPSPGLRPLGPAPWGLRSSDLVDYSPQNKNSWPRHSDCHWRSEKQQSIQYLANCVRKLPATPIGWIAILSFTSNPVPSAVFSLELFAGKVSPRTELVTGWPDIQWSTCAYVLLHATACVCIFSTTVTTVNYST